MTKYCKNPECKKEISDDKTYCNEECLKRYLELKKGFINNEGLVTGSHNATILAYLRQHQEEVYKTTVDKLTWLCHMTNRSLKENYLSGIEAFGIIETFTTEFGVKKWRWIGIKALRNNGSE